MCQIAQLTDFYMLCVYCELNLGPLHDQKVLLTIESSFQPSKKEFLDQLHLEKKKAWLSNVDFSPTDFQIQLFYLKEYRVVFSSM